MAASRHVARKLQEALGNEAADEVVTWMREIDALRGDVAELRHEMQVGFTNVRAEVKVDLATLEKKMDVGFAGMRTSLERGLKEQTRFFFLAWAALLASNIALWFR
jgi:hypothetical protein